MKHNINKLTALIMVLCFALSAGGCMGKVIAEDNAKLNLPQIDPEDGASRELPVTLYYRLTNEEYLVGVESRVYVRGGERTEAAVIRALKEGSAVSSGVTMLIPSTVSLQEVAYEDGILYVTLSDEFLNEDIVTSIKEEDYLKEKDYNNAVKAATQEMYLVRRLGVLSIVNTIAVNNKDVKVQILIEHGGESGKLSYEELGFESMGGVLIEPMGFDEEVVASEERIAACMLERMVKGEYEMAYALITAGYDEYKPAYEEFKSQMQGLGTVLSYEITDSGSNGNGTYVMANVRISTAT
ncbi:MAG: GerMN domain-containing protein, partial [Clostridia bacterium]|nr:GerMN domain-containing protein [Clostridia bacterium]